MASCTVVESEEIRTVSMGQLVIVRKPTCLTAILGSCVGVAIYHNRLNVGALGHVVLPQSSEQHRLPAKYANTAIPYMIQQLEKLGAHRRAMVAKLAGGACMFGVSGPLQIGDGNVDVVKRELAAAGVRVVGMDVGGTQGRRIRFDCSNGDLIVETVGNPARIL